MEYPAFAFQIQREESMPTRATMRPMKVTAAPRAAAPKFVPLEEYGADIEQTDCYKVARKNPVGANVRQQMPFPEPGTGGGGTFWETYILEK